MSLKALMEESCNSPFPCVRQRGLVASGIEPKRPNFVLPLVDLVGVLDGSVPQFPHKFAVG